MPASNSESSRESVQAAVTERHGGLGDSLLLQLAVEERVGIAAVRDEGTLAEVGELRYAPRQFASFRLQAWAIRRGSSVSGSSG